MNYSVVLKKHYYEIIIRMAKNRREYIALSICPVDAERYGEILTSSSSTKIDASIIEVEDYKSGFGSSADIDAGRDFQNLSFD